MVFRPLAGCGLFLGGHAEVPGQGVSVPLRGVGCFLDVDWEELRSECFRPLAGCGLFHNNVLTYEDVESFRPLAGCGLFRQSCTFFLVQQEKELSTLLFYCIILADVYQ